jgi:hypothetical protein
MNSMEDAFEKAQNENAQPADEAPAEETFPPSPRAQRMLQEGLQNARQGMSDDIREGARKLEEKLNHKETSTMDQPNDNKPSIVSRIRHTVKKTIEVSVVVLAMFICAGALMMGAAVLLGGNLVQEATAAQTAEDLNRQRIESARTAYIDESVRLGEATEAGGFGRWKHDPAIVGIISHDANRVFTFEQSDETVVLTGDFSNQVVSVHDADGAVDFEIESSSANQMTLTLPESWNGVPQCLRNPWIEVSPATVE